jgi:uncharacterized protein YjbI with pentapeptide repeats
MKATRRFVCLVLLTAAVGSSGAPPLPAGPARPDLDQLDQPALEEQKLREEIRALWTESDETWWERPETVPTAAALVALLSVLLTFWHQTRESARQRNADRAQARERAQAFDHQQAADRQEQAAERRRRYDELFVTVSANLAASQEALRLAAASSIEAAFLADDAAEEGREGATYRTQVFGLLVGVLSLERSDEEERLSDRVLARVLVKGLPSQLPSSPGQVEEPRPGELSLDGVFLQRTDLSRLDLRGVTFEDADLERAKLNEANLTSCNLRGANLDWVEATGRQTRFGNALLMDADIEGGKLAEARMRGTRFDGARLVSAVLDDADLSNANFTNASLQDAHLDRSILVGAVFDEADLASAYFRGAIFTSPDGGYGAPVLESILRANRWREAHWDPQVRAKLEELAGGLS